MTNFIEIDFIEAGDKGSGDGSVANLPKGRSVIRGFLFTS